MSEGLLRGLLKLYPGSHRRRFGDGMLHSWRSELEAARRRGRAALGLKLAAIALSATAHGLGERFRGAGLVSSSPAGCSSPGRWRPS